MLPPGPCRLSMHVRAYAPSSQWLTTDLSKSLLSNCRCLTALFRPGRGTILLQAQLR